MAMKLPPAFKACLLLSAILFAALSLAVPANAKSSASSPAASQAPVITPEQQKYKTAHDKCLKQYLDQKIPKSQHHTYMNACLKENGITRAVPMPHPELSLPPASPAKSPK
jgi:hypothetical protein